MAGEKDKLTIARELLLSTSHIRKETHDWLVAKDLPPTEACFLAVEQIDEGYRIYVSEDSKRLEFKELWRRGFGELAELLELARENQCEQLTLRADSYEIHSRPTFDW